MKETDASKACFEAMRKSFIDPPMNAREFRRKGLRYVYRGGDAEVLPFFEIQKSTIYRDGNAHFTFNYGFRLLLPSGPSELTDRLTLFATKWDTWYCCSGDTLVFHDVSPFDPPTHRTATESLRDLSERLPAVLDFLVAHSRVKSLLDLVDDPARAERYGNKAPPYRLDSETSYQLREIAESQRNG